VRPVKYHEAAEEELLHEIGYLELQGPLHGEALGLIFRFFDPSQIRCLAGR